MAKIKPTHNPGNQDLYWLLASFASVLALHVAYLHNWVSLAMAGFAGWRFIIAQKAWPMPRLAILLPITLAAAIGIAVSYHGLFGRDASVALFAIMLSLKLMETHTQRDYIVVIFLAYFLTANAFLFNQSIAMGIFMAVPITLLTATLVGVNHPNGTLDWRLKAKTAGMLLTQALPLMLIFFVLFPRLQQPLWGVPQDAYSGMTGLSDNMAPGNISKLSLSGATAFRVEFHGKPPAKNQLYWRGPVLSTYDGRTWRINSYSINGIGNGNTQKLPEGLTVNGPQSQYTVTLEPHNKQWLLMLDMPTTIPPEAMMTAELQVISKEPVRTRIRYEASSNFNYTLQAAGLSEREQRIDLQLPKNKNPKTLALAESWKNQAHENIVNTALKMYREEPFVYTLSPPPLGENAMDDFLFTTHRGFCEYYSSSFVYLMRAAGVPARVVTGYLGGEINPNDNYMIVRQSDAHAWAEVWLQNRGWVRIDPTGAVSPDRIELGVAESVNDSEALPLLSRRDYPLLRKLFWRLDAVNNGWNQWVLGYNQERQLQLLRYITGNDFSWQDLVIWLFALITSSLMALSYFILRGNKIRRDAIQKIYDQFLSKLNKAGLTRYKHEGPVDFSSRAERRLPAKAVLISQITDAYTQLRYASKISPAAIKAFKELVNNL
jgi:transglutaminase-like putative cysteine protease